MAQLKQYAPWIAVLLLLGFAGKSCYDAGQAKAESARSAQALRDARDTVGVLHQTVTTLATALSVTQRRVDTLWKTHTVTVHVADSFQVLANTAILAAKEDTFAVCQPIRLAYQARTSECAQLRVAIRADSEAITLSQAVIQATRDSLLGVSRTVSGLQASLAEIRKPYTCRLLLLACPSRGLMGVLGMAVGAGGVLILRH